MQVELRRLPRGMHRPLAAIFLSSLVLAAAAGCVSDPDVGTASQALGACGLGDEELATRTYTTARWEISGWV